MKPVRVDILSDIVCPWCVIGYYQLQKASGETETPIKVHWHPFELNPKMAAEGENLRDHLAAKYGTTPEGLRKARTRLTEMGAALGFSFNYADDMRIYNTFLAHQLIDWAEDQGKAHELKSALFEAFFSRRENISDVEVLTGIASSVGLDGGKAQMIMESGERGEMVRQKKRFWIERGIQGVPAMVFENRYLASGAQAEENYNRMLQQLHEEAVI